MTEKLKIENIVQPIKLGHVNIYLVKTEAGYILVDAGMPNAVKKIDQALRTHGVDADEVSLIILTHGHLDHAGAAAQLKAITGGKILCHRSFAEDLSNGKFEDATPQNLLGRMLNLMTGLFGSGIDPATADILVDDEYDLNEFGISGKIIHTPGHSPSSISIILDHGEVLVGDLIREEQPGKIGFGMFYEDRDTALESVKKIATFNPRIIYLSHSKAIDHQILNKFIAANQ